MIRKLAIPTIALYVSLAYIGIAGCEKKKEETHLVPAKDTADHPHSSSAVDSLRQDIPFDVSYSISKDAFSLSIAPRDSAYVLNHTTPIAPDPHGAVIYDWGDHNGNGINDLVVTFFPLGQTGYMRLLFEPDSSGKLAFREERHVEYGE